MADCWFPSFPLAGWTFGLSGDPLDLIPAAGAGQNSPWRRKYWIPEYSNKDAIAQTNCPVDWPLSRFRWSILLCTASTSLLMVAGYLYMDFLNLNFTFLFYSLRVKWYIFWKGTNVQHSLSNLYYKYGNIKEVTMTLKCYYSQSIPMKCRRLPLWTLLKPFMKYF